MEEVVFGESLYGHYLSPHVLAILLENIERENFYRLLAKCQSHFLCQKIALYITVEPFS